MSQDVSESKETWNHKAPVIFSPLFDWPPNFKAAFLALTKRWFTISRNVLFLLMAALIYRFVVPDASTLQTLSFGWVGSIFLRNYLFMIAIAGGLHLYLFTFRKQGSQLKYDQREQLERGRKFTFKNQVWDNVFWSLVSGTTIWSLYEIAYFWGIGNGFIRTLTFVDHPIVFVVWLLAIPILTSTHFYFIHRLLHWGPLYRSVHLLHHRNIHIGPWSGLSMHPVEHVFYISSVLIHFITPSHPVIFLLHIYSRCLGPAFSHSGFEKLVFGNKSVIDSADFHHQLHHRHFECNYGTTDAPWDKWFGEDHDGSEEATLKMRERRKRK